MNRDYNTILDENPELRRCLDLSLDTKDAVQVTSPNDIVGLVVAAIGHKDREHAFVIALDSANKIIDSEILSIGCNKHTVMSTNSIFRWLLTRDRPAAGLLIAHNHPSGSTSPSESDIAVTKQFMRAASCLGICLVDHIVVGGVRRYSMAEQGDLIAYKGSL